MSRLDAYRRDGFCVVRGLFDPLALEEPARDMAAVLHARAASLGLDLPARTDREGIGALLAGLFQADVGAYVAAAKLTQHLASVHRLGLRPELSAVVSELGLALPALATRPVIHYMADRLKIPGGYHKTPPHQDWRSTQGSLDSLTVWAPLYDVGEGDYPLEVVRGSHRAGLLDSTPDRPNHRVADAAYDEAAFEPVPLRAGDAVIFSGFLLHRTGVRGGEAVRVAFSFRFNDALEPRFVARNYPDPYLYRAEPAILTPGFPGPADVAPLFGEGAA